MDALTAILSTIPGSPAIPAVWPSAAPQGTSFLIPTVFPVLQWPQDGRPATIPVTLLPADLTTSLITGTAPSAL